MGPYSLKKALKGSYNLIMDPYTSRLHGTPLIDILITLIPPYKLNELLIILIPTYKLNELLITSMGS